MSTRTIRERVSDKDLVEQIRNGNRESLDILIKSYFDMVYNRIHTLVPESDVDDVTQEVFLGLVDSIDSFQGRSAFGTWLYKILMNKVADYHRKASSRKEQVGESYDPRIVNPWAATDDELAMEAVLTELPRKYKDVISLRISSGLSFAEIADKLGLTYEATRSRYRRGVYAVRQIAEA